MSEPIVTLHCLDGSVTTRRETLRCLASPLLRKDRPQLGRPHREVEEVVNALRDGLDNISTDSAETFRILQPAGRVVAINVGGTVLHALESTLRRASYFDAMLDMNPPPCEDGIADATGTFVDRDPRRFARVLAYLEDPHAPLPDCAGELAFFGVDPQPGHPGHMEPEDAWPAACSLISLFASGVQDHRLTGSPTQTSHFCMLQQRTRSSFHFVTSDMSLTSDAVWKTEVVDLAASSTPDMLGTMFLQTDLIRDGSCPTSQLGLAHLLRTVTMRVDGQRMDEISGLGILASQRLDVGTRYQIHEQPLADGTVRVTYTLPFWFTHQGRHFPVVLTDRAVVEVLADLGDTTVRRARVVWQGTYLDSLERRQCLQPGAPTAWMLTTTVSLHDEFTVCARSKPADAPVHISLPLPFSKPTKDLMILVEPLEARDATHGPLIGLEVKLNGHICLFLDGLMAGELLPQTLYRAATGHPVGAFTYLVPFDCALGDMSCTSGATLNLSTFEKEGCTKQLLIRLEPGRYQITVVQRYLNELSFEGKQARLT